MSTAVTSDISSNCEADAEGRRCSCLQKVMSYLQYLKHSRLCTQLLVLIRRSRSQITTHTHTCTHTHTHVCPITKSTMPAGFFVEQGHFVQMNHCVNMGQQSKIRIPQNRKHHGKKFFPREVVLMMKS